MLQLLVNKWMIYSHGLTRFNKNETPQSVYCYKDTDVLINKEHIRNARDLAQYEADITMLRQLELENEDPVRGRFGAAHLKAIHEYIFQDVYQFAGKYRVEDIWKGNTFFCKSEYIEENLDRLFGDLKKDKYLKGWEINQFSAQIAYYMSELNMIHPFREGNGRTIREYIRQLAQQAGYVVYWSRLDHDALLNASILSVDKELQALTECMYRAIIIP